MTSGGLVPTKHVNNSPVTLLGHKVVHVAQQGESVKIRVVIFSRHFFEGNEISGTPLPDVAIFRGCQTGPNIKAQNGGGN